jgi:hypothetical protein
MYGRKEAVPLLLPHLLKRVRNVKRADFLIVLELEELVPAVARHVHEDIRVRVGEKAFRARNGRLHPA